MSKYIIREVEPEACDFSFYFDGDTFNENSGDYCNTLFIVPSRNYRGFNADEYKNVQQQAGNIIDAFQNVIGRESDYAYWTYESYKEAMEAFGIPYNPRKCHALKEWAKDADEGEPESIAAFLTITTGKKWDAIGVCGYSQGDYVELVYCPEQYPRGVEACGEIWLGCAKEFCTIELDDGGEEVDACYGYIIADSEANSDADYKRLVCKWACIDEDEATLEMIDGYTTRTIYSYRTA